MTFCGLVTQHSSPVRRLCDKARNLTTESFNLPFAPSQILQFSRKCHSVQICFVFSGSYKEKDWLQAPVILEVPKAQDYRWDPGCHYSQEVLSEEPLYSYLSPVRKKKYTRLFICLFVRFDFFIKRWVAKTQRVIKMAAFNLFEPRLG